MGMMEYWNAGKMGKEKMTHCVIDKSPTENNAIK